MFDNEKFETQVQEKLHGLDLSPSPAVWDKIEAQLPPESGWRSVKILWGALMVAAMAAGGYFFFLNTKTVSDTINNSTLPVNTLTDNTKTVTGNNTARTGNVKDNGLVNVQPGNGGQTANRLPVTAGQSVNTQSGSVEQPANAQSGAAGQPINNTGAAKDALVHAKSPAVPVYNNALAMNAGAAKLAAARSKSNSGKGNITARGNQNRSIAAHKEEAIKNNIKGGTITGQSTDDNVSGEETGPVGNRRSDRQNLLADNANAWNGEAALRPAPVNGQIVYHAGFGVDATVKDLAKTDNVNPPRKMKRWSFEIGASGGQSIYSAGKVNKLFTAANASVLNSLSAPQQQTAFVPTAAYTPSEIKPGKSFSLGLDARYKLHKRLSITAGVYYSLLTTTMQTGRKFRKEKQVDMNGRQRQISEFYSAGYSNDYTNNYHFIELPVLLHLQLNKGRKLPLYLNAGLSYSRLFKTNALHYDAVAGIYYKADELIKKDFVNVEGGLSARLFPSKWYSIIIGPEIQYGITDLFKENVQLNDKHSLFLGFKASYPLPF